MLPITVKVEAPVAFAVRTTVTVTPFQRLLVPAVFKVVGKVTIRFAVKGVLKTNVP